MARKKRAGGSSEYERDAQLRVIATANKWTFEQAERFAGGISPELLASYVGGLLSDPTPCVKPNQKEV